MAKATITAPTAAPDARLAPALQPFGTRPRRTFALLVALPAFLLYALAGAFVFVALSVVTHDIDGFEARRGTSQMHAALNALLNDLASSVADEGTWNEAYLNVVVTPDPAWMDNTWGTTARLGQSYDAAIVTDNEGNIVFGEDAVGKISGRMTDRFPAAGAMLAELDKGIASTGDATTVANFSADQNGTAALAAISIHQSGQTTALPVPRDTRRVLWIVSHLTQSALQDMASRYQTPLASLVPAAAPDQFALDIPDAAGKVAGTIAWMPDRPGDAAFMRTMLLAAGIFLVLGAALAIGLAALRRAILHRADALDDAVTTLAESVPKPAGTEAPRLATSRGVMADQDPGPSAIDGVAAADFHVEYEPVFDLRAQTMLGAALRLRWQKPDKTLLLQETLAAAQNIVLLDRIGILALRRATDEIAPLLGMMLTVTVTPTQLMLGIFAEKLAATLSATNFPGRRLQLCVDAERLPPVDDFAVAVARIKRLGVSVALRDFTLTPATAAYLRPGLADAIHLSRGLVEAVDTDPSRSLLLDTTVSVARGAGYAVIVPFVGRKEEATKLLRLGCREFQGPLFAAPMPIAALTALILNPATRQAG